MTSSVKLPEGRPWKLGDRFNSMIDKFLTNSFSEGFSIPAMTHNEDDKNYYLKLITPGLKKEDIRLKLNDCILTVYSECNPVTKTRKKQQQQPYRELCDHLFNRSFIVPGNINVNMVRANFKDGVLNVIMPKRNSQARSEPMDLVIE